MKIIHSDWKIRSYNVPPRVGNFNLQKEKQIPWIEINIKFDLNLLNASDMNSIE